MERTIEALEAFHRRLLAQADGPEHAQELMALAASVPHVAPLIEARVPECATIMRPDDVRTMMLGLVLDLLRAQTQAVVCGATRRPAGSSRHARPLPDVVSGNLQLR